MSNINFDLKEEVEKLQTQISQLLIYKDDHLTLIKSHEQKLEAHFKEIIDSKDHQVNSLQLDNQKLRDEQAKQKSDFNMKMIKIQQMETEL